MQVRVATIQDVQAVASAYLASWKAGYAGLLSESEIEVQAVRRSKYDWLSAIRQSDRVVFLAEENGEVVGVVECEHDPKPGRRPWVQLLYVVPSAWGSGSATALLNEALGAVREAGHLTTLLEVVEDQTRARRFYERWSAVGVGLSGRHTAASPSIVARKVKSSTFADR